MTGEPLRGLLWCHLPGRNPVTVGLIVRDDQVVDGPPYARARGWVGASVLVAVPDMILGGARVYWLADDAAEGWQALHGQRAGGQDAAGLNRVAAG